MPLKTAIFKLNSFLNYYQTFSKSQNYHEVRSSVTLETKLSKNSIFSLTRKKDKNHEEKNVNCSSVCIGENLNYNTVIDDILFARRYQTPPLLITCNRKKLSNSIYIEKKSHCGLLHL